MSKVAIQRVGNEDTNTYPVLAKLDELMNDVRLRALELFHLRGGQHGHELDDWLNAEREILHGWPAAELKETPERYEINLTLPGYDAGEVEVTVGPNEIVVHADRTSKKEHAGGDVLWTEFRSNDVYRRFEFRSAIDPALAKAELDQGMLHIEAAKAAGTPKAEEAAA